MSALPHKDEVPAAASSLNAMEAFDTFENTNKVAHLSGKKPSVTMRAKSIFEDIFTMQVWPQILIYFSKDCSISIKGHKTGD